MANYATKNFWNGYYTSGGLSYDKKNFVTTPLQPFAGNLAGAFFVDLGSGITYYTGTILNWGPITAAQRGDSLGNNFPPNYTIFSLAGPVTP